MLFWRPSGCGGRLPERGGFGGAGEPQKQQPEHQPRRRVQDQHGSITSHRRQPRADQRLRQDSAEEGPESGGQRTGQIVPGEDLGALRAGDGLGESGLFDWQKRADFVAAGTDHADGGRDHEQQVIAGRGEERPGEQHQACADDQHASPAHTVGHGGQPERDQGVAEQGEGEQHADPAGRQADLVQVKHQHHGQETVGEHPCQARQKEEPAVGRQLPQHMGFGKLQEHA